jgi:hypothetical protein
MSTHSTDATAGYSRVPAREPLGAWDAMRASPLLVLFPILLLVGAGVAVGLTRDPNYTAQARLGVVHVDVSALSGSSNAAETLADTYSRAIDADEVVRPITERFHISTKDARARLSGAPIPESPVFRVVARATSQRRAIDLANAASESLLEYVQNLNRSDRDVAQLYRRLSAAELAYNERLAAKERRERDFAAAREPSRNVQLALVRARAATSAASDRVTALRTAYSESVGSGVSTELVEVLVTASDATSDRWTRLQLLAFGGLATGLALGVALAVARAARRRRVSGPA